MCLQQLPSHLAPHTVPRASITRSSNGCNAYSSLAGRRCLWARAERRAFSRVLVSCVKVDPGDAEELPEYRFSEMNGWLYHVYVHLTDLHLHTNPWECDSVEITLYSAP